MQRFLKTITLCCLVAIALVININASSRLAVVPIPKTTEVKISKDFHGKSLSTDTHVQTNVGLLRITADQGVYVTKEGHVTSDKLGALKRGAGHVTVYYAKGIASIIVRTPDRKALKVRIMAYKDAKKVGDDAETLLRKVLTEKDFDGKEAVVNLTKLTKRADMVAVIVTGGTYTVSQVEVFDSK